MTNIIYLVLAILELVGSIWEVVVDACKIIEQAQPCSLSQ
jgi:hypothetical protein